VTVYRLLLRLLPSRVRERHAREMEMLFQERLTDARRRSRLAVWGVWLRAGADIVGSIPHEIRRARRRRGQIGIPAERRSLMIGSDIRYAWRSLSHQRLGTALVVGMLALGIGATVAVFSLINGLFLRPFPFPESDRLVFINETAPKWNLEMTGINYADFAQWHRDQQAFEAIAVYDSTAFNVATDQGADRLSGAAVSIDFLDVLGLQPILGRSFAADEVMPNGPRVAMIGEALWHERFGGRHDVLGKELRLNSRAYTVIGVLPRAAEFPGGVRLWVPIQADPNDRDSYDLDGFGRLKPGVTVEQAAADLLRAHQPIFDAHDKERVVSPFVRDLRTQLTRDFGTIASTLGAAVGLLLIVACANVAALMLARALARRREIGIRLAVGASRTRLLRQLLVENILLSIAGGALGLLVGQAAIQLLVSSLPDQAPAWTTFTLDARMVLFTLLTSMLTVVLFGWAPALHAMNSDVRGAMSAATAGSTLPVRGRRTLRALVIAEFALASLMFVCGGLLVRAYDRVRNTDPGFDGANVLTFTVNIPGATYADNAMRAAFWNRLQDRLRVLPGVERAGYVSCAPVSGCHWGQFYSAEGAPPRATNEVNPVVLNRVASPDYFPSMGIRLKEGRLFREADAVDDFAKESVVVVNETFVKTFWPDGGSPIGKRVRSGTEAPWRTIVGVVHDVKHYGLERPMRPGVYLPVPVMSGMTMVLRTAGDPAAVGPAARAALREIDPDVAAYNMRTMDERLAQSRSLRAAYSWMLGVFAVMALLLALGGSYGVTQYLVSQRTRELGIRVALGAGRRDISRAVVTGSFAVVAIGVVLGVAGAIGAGRYLSSLLFGVPPYDAVILAIAAVALLSTGLAANWLPARRAARIDPMISLRAD
jgi:putative ABC transport system permease protein